MVEQQAVLLVETLGSVSLSTEVLLYYVVDGRIAEGVLRWKLTLAISNPEISQLYSFS